nr:3-deoxy-7-phosphoheptulonate synthase [Ardenticatena sp.]
MIVIMSPQASQEDVLYVVGRAESLGYRTAISEANGTVLISILGDTTDLEPPVFEGLPGVLRLAYTDKPYRLASRDFQVEETIIDVNGVRVGDGHLVVIAGPCSVESREQILETAHAVRDAGAHMLRGGAFKPRTSPYSFQGWGERGLQLLAEAREQTGLPIVTEVMAPEQVPLVAHYADVLQIGTRNMQNFPLLHAVGETNKPVLLKRGMMSTIKEWLMSAEYIMSHGNHKVILCERGIRTFENATRNTLDVNAVPVLNAWTHLPVIVDPSHAVGRRAYVRAATLAGVAAGADGLMIEVHPDPSQAWSDGPQSLTFAEFAALMADVRAVAAAVGHSLAPTMATA